jgi:membrane protein
MLQNAFYGNFKMVFLKALANVFLDSISSWIAHRSASKGAALAFYALFSLAPILILTISVAGLFFGDAAAQGQITHQIENLIGHNGGVAIQAILAASRDPEQGRLTTIVAFGILLIGATSVFTELKSSLDELWGVPKSELSAMSILLRTRMLSFGLVMVLTFLLLISLVISALLSVFEQYVVRILGSSALLFGTLTSLFSFCVIASLFAVIYKMLPDKRLSWQDVAIGSIFTACLFTLGKYLIGFYIGNSAIASSFGAAGSVIAILLWVYYSAQILFMGAEFTRQFALQFGSLRQYKQQQLELDKLVANPLML